MRQHRGLWPEEGEGEFKMIKGGHSSEEPRGRGERAEAANSCPLSPSMGGCALRAAGGQAAKVRMDGRALNTRPSPRVPVNPPQPPQTPQKRHWRTSCSFSKDANTEYKRPTFANCAGRTKDRILKAHRACLIRQVIPNRITTPHRLSGDRAHLTRGWPGTGRPEI